jgi:hypothetical protein
MMQTTNNFPTNIIVPMFGWIVTHFQEGQTNISCVHTSSWAYFEKENGR